MLQGIHARSPKARVLVVNYAAIAQGGGYRAGYAEVGEGLL